MQDLSARGAATEVLGCFFLLVQNSFRRGDHQTRPAASKNSRFCHYCSTGWGHGEVCLSSTVSTLRHVRSLCHVHSFFLRKENRNSVNILLFLRFDPGGAVEPLAASSTVQFSNAMHHFRKLSSSSSWRSSSRCRAFSAKLRQLCARRLTSDPPSPRASCTLSRRRKSHPRPAVSGAFRVHFLHAVLHERTAASHQVTPAVRRVCGQHWMELPRALQRLQHPLLVTSVLQSAISTEPQKDNPLHPFRRWHAILFSLFGLCSPFSVSCASSVSVPLILL